MARINNKVCFDCGGKCCQTLMFHLFSRDHARWARLHGLKIKKIRGVSVAEVPIACQKLKNNRCSIYKERPAMCRDFICDKMEKEGYKKILE